jgi:O-acetyl-ADP-ribose deacetylase (regulator of RNase III)
MYNEIKTAVNQMDRIKIIHGDITKLDVGAIVNAANSSLLGGGGVDGAIHRAAGKELLYECRKLHGCKTGQAKITKGYRLPAKYVIHTVGPFYRDGKQDDPALLYSCYKESLALAAENNVKTIAFPCISTGIFGYPFREACVIALQAINDFLRDDKNISEIFMVCFSKDDFERFEIIYHEFTPLN